MWELIARRTLLASSVLLAAFLGYLLVRNADLCRLANRLSLNHWNRLTPSSRSLLLHNRKVMWSNGKYRRNRLEYLNKNSEALLQDVSLTFYGGDGEEVTVYGDEGTLDTASKNFLPCRIARCLSS